MFLNSPINKMLLTFKSDKDLKSFKKECGACESCVEVEFLTLVGIFNADQIQLGINKYSAMCKMHHDNS